MPLLCEWRILATIASKCHYTYVFPDVWSDFEQKLQFFSCPIAKFEFQHKTKRYNFTTWQRCYSGFIAFCFETSSRNVKGEPQTFGSFPNPMPRPLFPLGVVLWWSLANPSCMPNLKLLASTYAQILKGNPKILGSFPSLRQHPLFPIGVILWWALANPSCIPNLKLLASAIG